MVPLAAPAGGVQFLARDTGVAGTASGGVEVDDVVGPRQVDLDAARIAGTRSAVEPEHTVAHRELRPPEGPQTDRHAVSGLQQVEGPLGRGVHPDGGSSAARTQVQGPAENQPGKAIVFRI